MVTTDARSRSAALSHALEAVAKDRCTAPGHRDLNRALTVTRRHRDRGGHVRTAARPAACRAGG